MKRPVISLALALVALCLKAQDGPQPYNMSFDNWSRSSGAWCPYPGTPAPGQRVWDSVNRGLSSLGVNVTEPEFTHVAVAGEGKAAAKIVSKKVAWAFVAGNLFTGRFVRVVRLSGAEINFGIPFHARPKSLSGYVHYIPATVNFAREPHLDMKGRKDVGHVEVFLADWDEPYHIITCDEAFMDTATDPHVIGRAVLDLDRDTGGYIHFEIPFRYNNGKTPRYVVIYAASSWYGADFTGGSGSTLYLDEFRFNY